MVSLKEFNNIRDFLAGPECDTTYEQWVNQYKPKREKATKIVSENSFETWWECYPGSANFTYRGMRFSSSRALRSDKQVCKMLYDSAVASKVATEDQIIAATKYMVEEAKKESFETGVNKLQFLPGSSVFLRQQRYLSFIEVANDSSNESNEELWA